MLLESIRPDLSRIAGFPVDMFEISGRVVFENKFALMTPLFGGIQYVEPLPQAFTMDVRRLEEEMSGAIGRAIDGLTLEVECRAVVDYRWPKAA